MLEDEKEDHEPRRAPYKRRRWQIGMLLFLLSNVIGSSIQITTLPLPLLSTLQASGLVFNALLASLLLKEPFTRRTLVGTTLVTGGAVLISFSSALPQPSHTLDQLLVLLVKPNFVVWMSLTLLLVAVIIVGLFVFGRIVTAYRWQSAKWRLARGMSYGLVSGVLSAHALLLAKSAVELLVRTIADHHNQFDRYQSWILLLLFLILAITQLYYLHLGLKLVTTSVLYPFVFCIYNIAAILDGLIYFRQLDQLPPLHAGLLALGTVILLTGVLGLSWRLEGDDESAEPSSASSHRKVELPRTPLTPGMGLIDDHDSDLDASTRDDPDPDQEVAENERAPLLMHRSNSTSTRAATSEAQQKRRRRRSTMLEAENIWNELRDEERYYGTLRFSESANTSPRRNRRKTISASGVGAGRTSSRGSRAKSAGGRVIRESSEDGNGGHGVSDDLGGSNGVKPLKRVETAPVERAGRRGSQKNWYSLDWWRKRRKDEEGPDDAEMGGSGGLDDRGDHVH